MKGNNYEINGLRGMYIVDRDMRKYEKYNIRWNKRIHHTNMRNQSI